MRATLRTVPLCLVLLGCGAGAIDGGGAGADDDPLDVDGAQAPTPDTDPAAPDAAPGAADAMPGAPDAAPTPPDAMPAPPDAMPPDAMPEPPEPAPRQNVIFYSGFETDPVQQGFNNYIQQPVPGSVVRSTEVPPRVGGSVIKFYMSIANWMAGGDTHAQVTMIDRAPGIAREGDENWYGVSYFLPSSYVATNEESILQWHHDSSVGSPPCALYTQGGRFVWDYITSINGSDQQIDLGPYSTNRWTDVVIHMKWSSTSAGLTEVYIDGVKKLTLNGPNMFAGLDNIYMLGIYKWVYKISGVNTTTSRTVYADEVRIGNAAATYDDVAPGDY